MHPFLLYCCYFTKRKLCENCTISTFQYGFKTLRLFQPECDEVNEAEPSESKVPFRKLNQIILKRFLSFQNSRFTRRGRDFSLFIYFCFEKKSYEIHKEKSETTTLVDGTLDDASRQFYPGMYVAFVTLLTYPVSTCAAEGSFSGMKGLKNPSSQHYE